MADVAIEYDVPVPMRDGVVLRADVYRPQGEGPWPVLVARTPYSKTDHYELQFLDPLLAARRGFIAVVQDVRGRFTSEGEFVPLVNEAADGADTIEWAASLPGSSGAVGMWGLSYLGNVQWQAASRQPSALKAIAPERTFRDPRTTLGFRSGAHEMGLVRSWGIGMGFDVLARRYADDEQELMKQLLSLAGAADGMPGPTYLELPTGVDPVIARYDLPNLADPAVMAAGDVTALEESVTVPSLHVAGWYDLFVQATIDNYVAAAERTPAKLVVGPWNHVGQASQQGDINFGLAGNGYVIDYATSILDLTFDWLHSWLTTGEAPGDDLPVMVYVMGANEWRSEPAWPLSRAVDTQFYLGAEEDLTSEQGAAPVALTFEYDPENPVPTVGGSTVMPHPPSGAFDQRIVEERPDVLVFTSEVLSDDIEVTGRVTATLTAATDGLTTDWVVRLCDVHPDGRSYNVVDGITRVQAQPGKASAVEVDLWSTSMLFKKGHRIRVQVTSSCFPRWDRNPNTADGLRTGEMRVANQTLLVGGGTGSFVSLPVVPGSSRGES
ncbi:CocE/NonD family hydrolase [Nocardioides pocheonensis]|uniref:CocE/NonD family hydrolase n=1 Tax=Nocardioides pocheonensis TaxID=661485 RepID=UPI001C82AD8E|nr:CocE/NonD family hydrolase [Nocardioides pocheonensis]